MKNSTTVKLIAIAMVLLTLFAACAPTGNVETFLDNPNLSRGSNNSGTSGDESRAETPEGFTEQPYVEQVINILPSVVAVVGTCEEDATIKITIRGSSKLACEVQSINGYFIAEVDLGTDSNNNILEVTATVEGKEESLVLAVVANYKATAEKRIDGLAVSVGKNSALVMDAAIDRYMGKDLLAQSAITAFIDYVNSRVKVLETRAEGSNDVSLVYVLIPDATAIYPEWLPEGVEPQTFKTKYQQYSEAIEQTNALLIDMTDIFLAHKDDGELLYNRTDSHITEYASYLVYTEITKVMEERFPDAKARPLSDFTKTTEVVNGGNMTEYAGIDGSIITEVVTRYKPNFNLKIGNKGTAKYIIEDIVKYVENSLKLTTGEKSSTGEIAFRTERTNLPSAIICRDENTAPMIDFLAERFNNVSFRNNFTVNITQAQLYATVNKKTVDYMFMIVSADNLDNLQESLQPIA